MSSGETRYIQHKNDVGAAWLRRISPQINRAGAGHDQDGYIDPQRLIYDNELQMILPGGVYEFDIEGTVYTLEGNMFVIIPSGMWHVVRGIESEGAGRAWMHFDWEFIVQPKATPFFTYAPGKPKWDAVKKVPHYVPQGVMWGVIPEPERVFELHERVCERFEKGTVQEILSARGLVLELFSILFSEKEQVHPESGSVSPGRIRTILARLAEEPFDESAPVRQKLSELGQSYDHLARIFKKAYSVTPLQFVNSLRMERAKNLLSDTTMNVNEIADRLGFKDSVYFSKLFRKLTGQRPSEFRK